MSVFNNSIKQILSEFDPIGLEEVNIKAALTSRVDKKYVIRPDQLPALLKQLISTHHILEINQQRVGSYKSVYFDTPDLFLYQEHHSGRANRAKFRIRDYLQSNIRFFEIKTRSNKGITNKERFQLDEKENLDELLQRVKDRHPRHIINKPIGESLQIYYERITLVSKTGVERVTIDGTMRFQREKEVADISDRLIIEVKTEKGVHSPTDRQLKNMGIIEGSISKYCFGIMQLHPNARSNNFKKTLHIINKQLKKNDPASSQH